MENAQVGVLLARTGRHGHAFQDRAMCLPKEWAAGPDRRQKIGIPKGVKFATKPALAGQMLERAWGAGVKAAW